MIDLNQNVEVHFLQKVYRKINDENQGLSNTI